MSLQTGGAGGPAAGTSLLSDIPRITRNGQQFLDVQNLCGPTIGKIPVVGDLICQQIQGLGGGQQQQQQPVPRNGQQRCGPGQVRIGNTCVSPGDVFPGGEPFTSPAGPPAGMKLACPGGFHPNKSSYHLRDGTFVPKGSKCVKNRRRNPLNPKALDRAMSRLQSAKKAAKKLSRVRIHKKKCK